MAGPTITIRDTIRKFVPDWLLGPTGSGNGYKFLYTFALLGDMLVQFALEGANASMPDAAPTPALAYIGRDRKIRRGIGESDADYALRLVPWLDDWRLAGSAFGILHQLRGYLNAPGTLRIVTANGTWWTLHPDGTTEKRVTLPTKNWNWDGNPHLWARFWVILYASDYGWVRDGTWGDGEVWGDTPASTWGANVPLTTVQTVRAIIGERKSGYSVCKNVIVSFDNTSFDPTTAPGAPLPDGTWALPGRLTGGATGTEIAARDARAVYWDGIA